MRAAAKGEGDTSCSCVHEKAPSSSATGPTQSEVSQSALVTLRRHAWVDGSSFPVPLQKPGTAAAHTHLDRNTHVMLCMRLTAFKRCQGLLNMLREVHMVLFELSRSH